MRNFVALALLAVALMNMNGGCRNDLTVRCQNGHPAVANEAGEVFCSCEQDANCFTGYHCVSGVCEPIAAPDAGVSNPCEPNPCQGGMLCVVEDGSEQPTCLQCLATSDCSEGERCVSGACALEPDMGVEPECASNEDCEAGMLCSADGMCTECGSDDECPSGTPFCNASADPNRCVACLTHADCGACSGDACIGGTCVQVPGGEVCDGLDNDCDGAVDEVFDDLGNSCLVGLGVCTRGGTVVCTATGLWTICDATPGAPSVEVCNGLDDDCDGVVDEGLPTFPTTCGVGACSRVGTASCTEGSYEDSCTPGAPALSDSTCNGLDEDCDGATDEGFVPTGTTCGTGLCAASGSMVCIAGGTVNTCTPGAPSAEVCDSADNDCDGETDEGLPVFAGTCGEGVCEAVGTVECVDGVYQLDCVEGVPSAEVCDGLDNDCDGAVDNGVLPGAVCDGADTDSCIEGFMVCLGGTMVCSDMTDSTVEVCNGLDDDCDGETDEGLGSTTCGVAACAHAVLNCVGGMPNFCNPFEGSQAEVCNGLDDNCDGVVDEGCPPLPSPSNMTIVMVDPESTSVDLQTDITATGPSGWTSYPDDTAPFTWSLMIAPAPSLGSNLYRFNLHRMPQGNWVCDLVGGTPLCVDLPTVVVDTIPVVVHDYSATSTSITVSEIAAFLDPRTVNPTMNFFYCSGSSVDCELNCDNGLDDNGDGLTDSDDPNCT